MNGYELSRQYWDYAFENPGVLKPSVPALYFFAVDTWNRLGQKERFGFPSAPAMEALNVSYNTFKDALDKLADIGFITIVQKSQNQHKANVISLCLINGGESALSTALLNGSDVHHQNLTEQLKSTEQSNREAQDKAPETYIEQQITNNKPQTTGAGEGYDIEVEIMKHFGFNEMNHFNHLRVIREACSMLEHAGHLKHFETQVRAYIQYLGRAPDWRGYGFKNFIGTSRLKYSDGGWNEAVWSDRLIEAPKEQAAVVNTDFFKSNK